MLDKGEKLIEIKFHVRIKIEIAFQQEGEGKIIEIQVGSNEIKLCSIFNIV